jgi:hypothetical protein
MLSINEQEYALLLNAALSGLGEGCNDCYRVFSDVAPTFLSRNALVLLFDPEGDLYTQSGSDFFSGKNSPFYEAIYHEVFGETPTLPQLIHVFNAIDIDRREHILPSRHDDFTRTYAIKAFQLVKTRLAKDTG